jgi:hypothetical protein
MARHELPREDLIRDARNLVRRVELLVPPALCEHHVVVGCRNSGDLSVYFGEDSAYHFNARGELRRAFVDGALLKAEAGCLIAMRRHRPGGEVQLRSRHLDPGEQQRFMTAMQHRLRLLLLAVESGSASITRSAGDAGTINNVAQWLSAVQSASIAIRPHAGH